MSESKAVWSRRLRYKRPALASLGYDMIVEELWEISSAVEDVQWFVDQGDETLLNALDGDDEAEWEFRMAFAVLSAKVDQVQEMLSDWVVQKEFDDCTVALIGNRYETVGFDMEEEDYSSLLGYDRELAFTEAGKRVMRHTKPEMLSLIGQCLGVVIAFLDLRQSYDYLKATFEILRDENTSLLKQIKEIDAAYEAAEDAGFRPWDNATRHFDRLLDALPQRAWLE